MSFEFKKPIIGNYLADQSIVYQATGIRGSGKTLLLTRMAIEYMVIHKQRVLSNFHIHGEVEWEGEKVKFESEPFDVKSLALMQRAEVPILLIIDELPLFALNRTAMSINNRILALALTQIRKRHMSLAYSCQNENMADKWIAFQNDVRLECRDLFKLNPAESMKHGVKPGERIFVRVFNVSGILPFSMKQTRHFWLNGSSMFPYYDTWEEIDLLEALTPTKLELGYNVISRTDLAPQNYGEGIAELVEHYRDQGLEKISSDDFWKAAKQKGIDGQPKGLGHVLRQLGVKYHSTRKGNYYDLSGVEA